MKWEEPDIEGIRDYMIENKIMSSTRVGKALDRISKCKGVLVPPPINVAEEIDDLKQQNDVLKMES